MSDWKKEFDSIWNKEKFADIGFVFEDFKAIKAFISVLLQKQHKQDRADATKKKWDYYTLGYREGKVETIERIEKAIFTLNSNYDSFDELGKRNPLVRLDDVVECLAAVRKKK